MIDIINIAIITSIRVQILIEIKITEQDASEAWWYLFVTLLGLCPRPLFTHCSNVPRKLKITSNYLYKFIVNKFVNKLD